MTGTMLSFSAMAMAIAGRAASDGLDPFEIMLYRSLFGVVIEVSATRLAGTLGQIIARCI